MGSTLLRGQARCLLWEERVPVGCVSCTAGLYNDLLTLGLLLTIIVQGSGHYVVGPSLA